MAEASAPRPIGLLIAALGGEGGGVLCNWIVATAQANGLPVQSTSIPGVAQRTGATTYYLEIWPETRAALDDRQPVLSLAAAPGEVDVVLASELLEAGRILLQGFVTPDRTCLIASTHRVFTTGEKMAMGDGRLDPNIVGKAAEDRSKLLISFDMQKTAEAAGAPISAILLGALAGSNTLPLDAADFRRAIETEGKSVTMNLRGFDAGLNAAVATEETAAAGSGGEPLDDEPAMSVLTDAEAKLPAAVHATLRIAIPRLIDYQDAAYATAYVDRLAAMPGVSGDVLNEVARQLAVRMSYEDAIRVAQVKLRSGRMERIRREAKADGGEPVYVTDHFKPSVNEIADILPDAWARRMLAKAERDAPSARWQKTLSLRTDRLGGVVQLWVLAGLRRWRRRSYRFLREQTAIDSWLADIADAAKTDPALALEIAKTARLLKGYGDTHARGTENFKRLHAARGGKALQSATDLAAAREAAMADPDGKRLDELLS